jgi:WD40 repeat protein
VERVDVSTWQQIAALQGHKHLIQSVVLSPDGDWLASAGQSIRIWDLSKKELVHVLDGQSLRLNKLAVSPDGKRLAACYIEGMVRIWDTSTWDEIAVLKHGVRVYDVAFTPDGERLACACANHTIRFWDMATHTPVTELLGHEAYVFEVAFSPDGTRLVSASGDYTVRLWDTLSARERAEKTEPTQNIGPGQR